MAKVRILSLDGGGIRGLLTARLLERLAADTPRFLRKVGLFAGTSTGGILALGLAAGRTPARMAELYRDNAERIFDDSWWDDLKDLGKVTGAEYGNQNLKRLLQAEFGEARLRDLGARRVLVSSFDLDNEDAAPGRRQWKPKFFHNYPGEDTDGAEAVVDVALRTSAAPTYFPSYQGYVDGGVVANNPSMAALAQVLDRRIGRRYRLADVVLLSLGTGSSLKFIAGSKHDWGFSQWVKPLIELLLDGTVGVPDYQCRQILGASYHRLAPVFPAGTAIKMDDVRRLDELEAFAADVDLAGTLEWLERWW